LGASVSEPALSKVYEFDSTSFFLLLLLLDFDRLLNNFEFFTSSVFEAGLLVFLLGESAKLITCLSDYIPAELDIYLCVSLASSFASRFFPCDIITNK